MARTRPPRPQVDSAPSAESRSNQHTNNAKNRAAKDGGQTKGAGREIQNTATRIACIRVPLFTLAARLRAEPELLPEGVAIFEGSGHQARVIAATRLAREAGLRPGQTLAQARALLPKVVARARDPECERSAQDALLDIAGRFSPRVEDANEGMAFLDTSGLERHYRSASKQAREANECPEMALGHELLRALESVRLPARVGIAASKLAARVAASLPRSPHVVSPGEEADFLAPLSLDRLSPEAETAGTLRLWGIETVGQFAALETAEVASRLGDIGNQLHQAARGLDPQPLQPTPPSPIFREGMSLEWPLTDLEPFLFIARTTLERLAERLKARGLGCQKLELSMQLEPDGFHERSIQLPSPTREVRTLLTLVRLDLEAHPPGSPVSGFCFLAHPDAPKLAQLSLLGPAALSPDRLATTIARLFALLGPGRVGSPRTMSGHRPERFQLVEYIPPPPPKIRPDSGDGHGLLAVRVLRPPLEVEVEVHTRTQFDDSYTSNTPSAPGTAQLEELRPGLRPRPVALQPRAPDQGDDKRTEIQGEVRIASGPWELEEAWWAETPTRRDYWDVELSDGSLYRLFRDRRTDRWYVDGLYD